MTNADKFKHLFGIYATELWTMPGKDFLEWLNADAQDVPTAERKTGKWIDDGTYGDYHPHHAWHCSECEESVIEIDTPWFKFCPNCGAKMEGEKDG